MFWDFFNTLRPRQNVRHFSDDIFKCIFVNKNVWISIKISLKFVPRVWINNIPALVKIMAWRRPGDKPLSEPNVESFLTHICFTRPQWDNINVVQSVYATNLWLLIFFEPLLHITTAYAIKRAVMLCFVLLRLQYDILIDTRDLSIIAHTFAFVPFMTNRMSSFQRIAPFGF